MSVTLWVSNIDSDRYEDQGAFDTATINTKHTKCMYGIYDKISKSSPEKCTWLTPGIHFLKMTSLSFSPSGGPS